MDVFDRILQDHDRFREQFARLADAARAGDEEGTALFTRLATEIEAHQMAEENLLFPALLAHADTASIAEEGTEEHMAINLFSGYMRGEARKVRWESKVGVYRELTEHHLEEEEEDMFPRGRAVLPKPLLEELALRFDQEKQRYA